MLIKKEIKINQTVYSVTLSDDRQALQAAYAAGGAVVGLYGRAEKDTEIPDDSALSLIPDLSPALYVAERAEDVDGDLLRKAVCRRFGLPLEIAVTGRLIIREFRAGDSLPSEEREFSAPERLSSYIACQYRFYECGLWALEERTTGKIVGKAGITGGELGYHIYSEYRRRGFGEEACRAILDWAKKEGLGRVRVRIRPDNTPSLLLAEKLGFTEDRTEEDLKGETEDGQENREILLHLTLQSSAPPR